METRLRYLNPEIDAAITAALRMHPDRPGTGRLCQELLARVTHRPITTRIPRSISFAEPPFVARKPARSARVHTLARRIAKLEALLIEGKER